MTPLEADLFLKVQAMLEIIIPTKKTSRKQKCGKYLTCAAAKVPVTAKDCSNIH
jgi:hypothetical protein